MNERTTLEIIAPTVEEALAQGLAQLGLQADAVSVEVLDTGTKGLFGLGGRQVRVRLTVNPPSEVKTPASEVHGGKSEPESRQEASIRPATDQIETTAAGTAVHDKLLDAAETVVSRLIHYLGMKAQISAHYEDAHGDDRRSIHVDIRGEDLSALIGRHAETLNAFQFVASLIIGKGAEQWVHLVVDVEGYRGRREKQLRQLARRMAEQVVKTGRRATLEPMTSGERRVIHIELRGHPAVTTESTGEEPYRKVMIIPKDS